MRVARTLAALLGGLALLTTAGCAGGGSASPAAPDPVVPTTTAATPSGEFGTACGAVPKDGPDSSKMIFNWCPIWTLPLMRDHVVPTMLARI